VAETADARLIQADQLREEVESLKRERQRLVRLVAATDDPVPEVVDALRANQERASDVARALAVATQPVIDDITAARLEAAAQLQVNRLRQQLAANELREVLTVLLPNGLRFKVGSGMWLIQGAASVPTVRNPNAVRIPDANQRSLDGDSPICARHTRCFPPSRRSLACEHRRGIMNDIENGDKKWKQVYTIVEREGLKKPQWVKIGIAFINHDQSLTVRLDAIPVNGRVHIRDPEPYDPTRGRRPPPPTASIDPFTNERVIS
jgi:hypothetical protein